MLNQDRAGEIFEKIRKYSAADDVEVIFYSTRNALTRFANSVIHQNLAEENIAISVRTVVGGRTARATTNRIDDSSLKSVVQASENLARVQHPDPDLLPMAARQEMPGSSVTVPSRYFEQTAAIIPEQRAARVRDIVGVADRHKL